MEEKGWEWQGVLRGGEASCFSPEPSTGETQLGLPGVPLAFPLRWWCWETRGHHQGWAGAATGSSQFLLPNRLELLAVVNHLM